MTQIALVLILWKIWFKWTWTIGIDLLISWLFFNRVHIDNFSIIDSLAPSIFIEKIVYMNLDQNNQPISDQISKVQVLWNQMFLNIKTHAIWAKKLIFSRYELGPFSSSYMRWPVIILVIIPSKWQFRLKNKRFELQNGSKFERTFSTGWTWLIFWFVLAFECSLFY